MGNWRYALGVALLLAAACDGPPSSVAEPGAGDGDGTTTDSTGTTTGDGDGDLPTTGDGDGDGDGDSEPDIDAGVPDAGEPDAGPGDLTINPARAIADLAIDTKLFAADACELDPDEDCVAAPGLRRLLYFAVETPNIGENDIFLGRPSPDNPNFVFSSCHGHYHFLGFAEYSLVDGDDKEIAAGRKQAFCLVDSEPFLPGADSKPAKYTCGFQGIQSGWSDVYAADLPCQFLDITDVPDGEYELILRVNNGDLLPETRRDNNEARIPISIGSPDLETPTEPCPDLDEHSSTGLHRECGWDLVATYTCTPGRRVEVGCAENCGVGSCTGDPMIRVCDGGDGKSAPVNCNNQNKLGADTNACGSSCPRATNMVCPSSGNLAVYAGPEVLGGEYTCEPELRE